MPYLQPLPFQTALARLAAGSTLVTVNRRTARSCAAAYAEHRRAQGDEAWETPDILPYAGWLRRWLHSPEAGRGPGGSGSPPLLLEEHQQRLLWERIIREQSREASDLPEADAAAAAMEAWEILQAWYLPWEVLESEAVEDCQAFLGWARRYRELCRENGWLDGAGAADWIAKALGHGGWTVPAEIILAGFDELCPQQQNLLERLESLGCTVYSAELPGGSGSAVLVQPADPSAEIEAAARWARSCLEADPGQRIGIVVPDLRSRRAEISRRLDEALHPESLLPDTLDLARAYNISLGDPLSEHPLVRTGLLLLEASQGPLDLETAGELLRSPFLAGAESEAALRAELDVFLRREGEPQLDLEGLLRAARREGPYGPASILAESLEGLLAVARQLPSRQLPSQWVQAFLELLRAAGWPGERTLSSREYQTMLSWREVQGRLAQLDLVAGRIQAGEAVAQLKRLSGEGLFQPSQPEVPVQVLGLLEAAGEGFDRLWIMGMDSEAWPSRPHPSPLLPASVQRRFKTPHASAERELAFARSVTRRLLSSADRIVVSSPQCEQDRRLQPSPLLDDLERAETDRVAGVAIEDYWEGILRSGSLEGLEDTHGPPLRGAAAALRGGTGLIKAQSECPFRAFAAYRLGAEPLPAPGLGLTAAERGILVHTALQHAWRELGDLETLLGLAAEDRRELARRAAERAVAAEAGRKPQTFTPRFRSLELGRLQSLLQEWLEVEAGRAPFRVQGLEERRGLQLPGLSLEAFIDRIDRLPDGRLCILDYKTGRHRPGEWFGERPSEPQLPLYALACREPLAGVAFAQIRKGESRFLGLASQDGILPGTAPLEASEHTADRASWPEVVDLWEERINALAREIAAGFAAVMPNHRAGACEHCELLPLCRKNEAPGAAGEGEESGHAAA